MISLLGVLGALAVALIAVWIMGRHGLYNERPEPTDTIDLFDPEDRAWKDE